MENLNMLWFYLEPYVFISEDSDAYLFYNAYTKKGISFFKNEMIDKVVKYLQYNGNFYSIRIGVKELYNEHLYNFIQSLQNAEFGDLIEGHLQKPIILPPVLNLQRSVENAKKYQRLLSDDILSNLHDVTIYVNGQCKHNCKGCSTMYKQFTCCKKSNNSLDIKILNDFLYDIYSTGASIQITGGNIFQYPELKKLFSLLEKRSSPPTFIINYRHIPEDSELINLFNNKPLSFQISVNISFHEKSLLAISERLLKKNINQIWDFCIKSISEYEKSERIVEQLTERGIKVNIKPFYTGDNLDFFKDHVFIQHEDIMEIELDRQGVFALQKLNTNDFGKITIMTDGQVYANVNKESIGSIKEEIGEVLYRELMDGDSWRNTRYYIKPCNQCRFKLICPSQSNYELVIGKHNLCHVMN